MRRIAAVTGATGLIGRQLIKLLLNRGWNVRVLARGPISAAAEVRLVQGSIGDQAALGDLVEGADYVFNCAGERNRVDLMQELNAEAPAKLAEVGVQAGVRGFCHLSSAGVFGSVACDWVDEEAPCNPVSVYEKSKWEGEQRLSRIDGRGMKIWMLRPTNVVNDEMIQKEMAGSFSYQFLHYLFKGKECAHWLHVTDVARAAIHLADSQAEPGVYIVGCDEDAKNTHAYLINALRRCGGRPPFGFSPLPVDFAYHLRRMLRGHSLHGRSRFSSAKLLSTGFALEKGVDQMIQGALGERDC